MKLADFCLGMLVSLGLILTGFWITGIVCAVGLLMLDKSLVGPSD